MSEKLNLKPCPFCGAEAELLGVSAWYSVRCPSPITKCPIQPRMGMQRRPWETDDQLRAFLAEQWNTRADSGRDDARPDTCKAAEAAKEQA